MSRSAFRLRNFVWLFVLSAACGGGNAKPTAPPAHAASKKCKPTCAGANHDAGANDAGAADEGADAGSASPNGDATVALGSGLCTRTGDCEENIEPTSAFHVEGAIDYPDPPPTGGNHNPCWASYGVHDSPVPDENWVHNLEHGAVVFLYQCACANELAELEQFVNGHRLTLLTEYDNMKKRFAIVAWGYRLQTDTLDMPAFEAFYQAHVDQGLESIASDPPSSCGSL